jgi:hypothetical protein
VPSPKPESLDGAPRILADLHAEHNAQKLKIAYYAACAHKRGAITANP